MLIQQLNQGGITSGDPFVVLARVAHWACGLGTDRRIGRDTKEQLSLSQIS
jgi:hypothetical protein